MKPIMNQTIHLHTAQISDLEQILKMMLTMYGELNMKFTLGVAKAVEQMLSEPHLGEVFLIQAEGHTIGYATLSRWFSPEREGWTGYLDELWLQPDSRNRGWGTEVVHALIAQCQDQGLKTLCLELEDQNTKAQQLSQRLGFVSEARKLMTRRLLT